MIDSIRRTMVLFAVLAGMTPTLSFAISNFTVQVTFSPSTIVAGDQTTFSWQTMVDGIPANGAGSCAIGGVPGVTGDAHLSGSAVIAPTTSLTASVECDIVAGQGDIPAFGEASLVVQPPGTPTVSVSFSPTTIPRGTGVSTFSWISTSTTTCSSNELAGVSGPSGSISVPAPAPDPNNPALPPPINVTVTCVGANGQASSNAALNIIQGGTPQAVIFAGTGGVSLETATTAGPFNAPQSVWIDFPSTDYGGPGPGQRVGYTDFFSYYMALRPDPSGDPDKTVPVPGHPPLRVVSDASLDDGLRGSGCLTHYIGRFCPFSYFNALVDELRASGIEVKVVDYDWRQAWTQHYALIRQAIDEAYVRGNYEKVYFMGHSQGTALASKFLIDNPEYQAKVALNFNIGGVLRGTPAATMSNTSRAGGQDFGLGLTPPMFVQKVTGLRIGGYAPATYHMNPARELLDIVHYNTGKWMFSDYEIRNGVGTRRFPTDDTVESALQYMRSLAVSQTLFDRAVQVQDALAAGYHGVPSYQIMNPDIGLTAEWVQRTYEFCFVGCVAGPPVVSTVSIPGDGTAPTASGLGRFSGGPSRGILRIQNTDHMNLIHDPRVLNFISRAIQIDRGRSDASFGSDFPLMSDDDMLAYIGWSLPGQKPGAQARANAQASAAFSPVNTLEFSTTEVEAAMTITLTNKTTQEQRVYQASKAGVTLISPVDTPDSGEIHLDFGDANSVAPVLRATSSKLFRDGFGDDVGMPDGAIAGDLSGLDVSLPMTPDPYDITITADRNISGLVRVSGPAIYGTKIVLDAGIASGETLHYVRDDSTVPEGVLYRGVTALQMTDDTP